MASQKKGLFKRPWFYLVLAVLAAGTGLAVKLLRTSGGLVVYYTAPKRETVHIRMVESGVLDSESSVNVIAPMVPGYRRLLISLVPEGAMVAKGTVLARCDTSDLQRDYENTLNERNNVRARYRDSQLQYEINLTDLSNQLLQRLENQKVARMNYEQMAFAADLDRQKTVVQMNQSKMDVEWMLTRISSEMIRRDTGLRNIALDISNVQKRIDNLSNYIDWFTITAPEDGLVVYPLAKIDGQERKIQVGDSLYYGQVFLSLPNLSRMIITIEVPEDDIKKLSLGQRAELILEAWKDRVYHGVIIHISNLAKIKDNNKFVKVFTVRLKVLEEDTVRLRPGMNARVTVALRDWPDAFTAPLPFLSGSGTNACVWAWDGSRVTRTPVRPVDQTETLAVFDQPLPARMLLVDRANQDLLTASNATAQAFDFREWRDAAR